MFYFLRFFRELLEFTAGMKTLKTPLNTLSHLPAEFPCLWQLHFICGFLVFIGSAKRRNLLRHLFTVLQGRCQSFDKRKFFCHILLQNVKMPIFFYLNNLFALKINVKCVIFFNIMSIIYLFFSQAIFFRFRLSSFSPWIFL